MSTSDPQLARLMVLLATDSPAPEPSEHELRQILDHITVSSEPKAETKAETAEARQ